MNWFLREYLRALCTCRIWTNYPPHFWPIREHKRSPRDTFMFILCTFPIYQTNLWRTLTQCRIIKFRMWKSLKLESKAKTFYRTLLHLGCYKYWFCTFKRDKQARKRPKEFLFIVNLDWKCYRHEERVMKLLLLRYSKSVKYDPRFWM